MIKHIHLAVLVVAVLVGPARAQDNPQQDNTPDCTAIAEAIVDLRAPEYASAGVWALAQENAGGDERLMGGMITGNGGLMGVAERRVPGRADIEIVTMLVDGVGRIEWEQTHQVPGLRALVAVAPGQRGVWALGQRKMDKSRAEIWLGFFDAGGALVTRRTIAGKLPLVPNDILNIDANSLMVAASEETPDGRHHSVIYRLDAQGRVTSRTAYTFGLNNNIATLSLAGPEHVLAAGSVESDDDRPGGWLMLVNRRGDIVWQRPYPRGRAAQFNAAADYTGGMMIVAGQSTPLKGGAGGDNRAAWVMVFDRVTGEPVWQRYYRGDMHFSARDILSEGDVFSVLMEARRPEGGSNAPHAQLLTFNGRGHVLSRDVFENADGVVAEQMIRGPNGERIIMGDTSVTIRTPIDTRPGPPKPGSAPQVPSEEDPSVEIRRSRDLWALAAVPVRAPDDPCAVKPAAE